MLSGSDFPSRQRHNTAGSPAIDTLPQSFESERDRRMAIS
jgi:hypothetical protein